jgi:hypothetical protein
VVITTREEAMLINNLREIFDNLDRYKHKLNPMKCSFGVPAGQLHGFLVSTGGIEANCDTPTFVTLFKQSLVMQK